MLYIAGKIQPDSCYKEITHWIIKAIINIITDGQIMANMRDIMMSRDLVNQCEQS